MDDETTGVLEASHISTRPPVDDLVRAVTASGVELREDAGSDGRTLFGHFAVFNRWTEIDSWFEGNFMERIAPGAAKKSFRERQPKVLFQHGNDPELRDRVIASLIELREDETGAYYEARLLDGLPELLLSGLRAGEYGASFRFGVLREEWNEEPGVSDENPKGLPERTIKEMRISEFGPVTFPAYAEATAGVRSLTDEFNPAAAREFVRAMKGGSTADLRGLVSLIERRDATTTSPAPPVGRAETESHPAAGRREEPGQPGVQDPAPPSDRAEASRLTRSGDAAVKAHYGLLITEQRPPWAL